VRLGAGLLVLTALLAAACRRPGPPPPSEPAPPLIGSPRLEEEPLAPTGRPAFEIGMLDWKKSDDGRELFVEGTVKNVGTGASQDVKVWIDGLDAGGTRVARAEVLPSPQSIPPGSAARFMARLPNDGAIRSFKVEAIGR
jgi:hypothetical protein